MSALPEVATEDQRLVTVLEGIGQPPKLNTRGTRKLNKRCKKWIVELMAVCPSPKMAADLLGCTATTIHRERHRDPNFKRAYSEAIAIGREGVASLVYEEAFGMGHDHLVVKEGSEAKVLAIPKARSEKMLELAFKMQHKDVFFTQDINVSGNLDQRPPGSLCIYVAPDLLLKLSKEEQKQLTTILAKLEAMKPKTINGEAAVLSEPQRIAHG